MKKKLAGAFIVLLLTGCGTNIEKNKPTTEDIFKEELVAVSEIGESVGKSLSEEINLEEIEEVFSKIFELDVFESYSKKYGNIIQGAGSDGNGGKIFCCKLPVEVTFIGVKESIGEFVRFFEDLDMVVSFGDFKVNELEENKYEVTTLINFLGKAAGGNLSEEKKQYMIKRNEVEVKEEEEITLRDFDLSMIIRPSNSDSSAISLGVSNDDSYRVYGDGNFKKDVKITFSNEGNKYYCECSINNEMAKKTSIKPSSNILFDILSCDIEEDDDQIFADLYLDNKSNKKVSVFIYEDDDKRVNIKEKSGNIEVKNK